MSKIRQVAKMCDARGRHLDDCLFLGLSVALYEIANSIEGEQLSKCEFCGTMFVDGTGTSMNPPICSDECMALPLPPSPEADEHSNHGLY